MESPRFAALLAGILVAVSMALPFEMRAQGACCQNAGTDGGTCLGEFDEFCDEFSECGGCGGEWIPGADCSDSGCQSVPRGACCFDASFCSDDQLDINCSGQLDVFYGPTSTCVSQGELCGVLPIELVSFEGRVDGTRISLKWETASETNNAGFEIERRMEADAFAVVGFVSGQGSTTATHRYEYAIEGAAPGTHAFRLKQTDYDGAFSYSQTVELTIEVPGRYFVESAYPNPFNPSTSLRFGVSVDQDVNVTLHDASGAQVRVLQSGLVRANQMQAVRIDADDLSSGTYFVRITGRDFTTSEQIVLVK